MAYSEFQRIIGRVIKATALKGLMKKQTSHSTDDDRNHTINAKKVIAPLQRYVFKPFPAFPDSVSWQVKVSITKFRFIFFYIHDGIDAATSDFQHVAATFEKQRLETRNKF